MGVLDPVVLRLLRTGITRQTPTLPQRRKPVLTTGDDLVDVALVPGVEDDRIARGVEDAVDGQGQFDDAEVGTEMSTGLAHLLDQERPNLRRQLLQLIRRQRLEIARALDGAQQAGLGRHSSECM